VRGGGAIRTFFAMSTKDAPARQTPEPSGERRESSGDALESRFEAVGKLPDRPSGWLFSAIIGGIACVTLIGSFEFHHQIRRWPLILSVVDFR
jgi:hypothetical protein